MERNKAVKLAQELHTRLLKGRCQHLVYKNPAGEVKIITTRSMGADMVLQYHKDWIIGVYGYSNPPSIEAVVEDILDAA
jgi:hypothetical protein